MVETIVQNGHDTPIVVYVEPWLDEYELRPEEQLKLVGMVSNGEIVECVSHEGGVTVWFGDASEVEGVVLPARTRH